MKNGFKKIFYLLMLGVMMYAPNAMAISCTMKSDSKDLTIVQGGREILMDAQIPKTVHLIIVVIQIAVPIILVILGMIDLFKAVTASKEDEIKKAQGMFFKRLVAAVIVFFAIAIVRLVISFADTSSENIMGCADCFINGSCGEK